MSKKSTKAQEALQFLDDLDFSVDDVPASDDLPDSSSTAAPASSSAAKRASLDQQPLTSTDDASKAREDLGDQEAEDALKFLNDLTQKSSSRPSSVPPPASPQVTTAAPSIAPNPAVPTAPAPPLNVPTSTPAQAPAAASSWGGWGVPSTTSLWGSASAALQQARDAAEALQREGTKAVSGAVGDMASEVRLKESAAGVAEEGRKWTGGMFELVKGVDLHKLRQDLLQASQHSLTTLLSTIAPPISEHEIIEIWLTHDMTGYEGVDGLVYRGLSKILEQVEGGELVVNKGKDDVPKTGGNGKERDLNAIEGFEAGFKLAEASIQDLIKKHEGTPSHPAPNGVPITVSPVFLRIQPILAPLPFAEPSPISLTTLTPPTPASPSPPSPAPLHLYFLLLLSDPSHNLRHSTVTQAVPRSWMEIPYEENEWVEEALVEVIRKGVEVVGQDYVGRRMGLLKGEGDETPVEGDKKEAVDGKKE